MKSKPTDLMVACMDRERRTCIAVERTENVVRYIPLDIQEGLAVLSESVKEFDDRFRPMLEYPVAKAAALYAAYARTIGATEEAMNFLSSVAPLDSKEIDMAVAKKKAATKAVQEKAAKAKTTTKKPQPAKKAAATKAPPAAKKPAKEPRAKGQSAASMFQELIMQGRLTDDQIFAKVQEKFGLDDKKKGYVKWYRNHLKKIGQNPPDAK